MQFFQGLRRSVILDSIKAMSMSSNSIKEIKSRSVLDSRGNPTVQSKVILQDGSYGIASVPSGASTGTFEAWELRDGAKAFQGKGVSKAVNNVNTKIAKKLKGMDVSKLRAIDQAMIDLDGTENKHKLGANAILSVSLAAARAGAMAKRKPLYEYIRQAYRLDYKGYKFPLPMMNVLNGGQHAANTLSFQEFMIVPKAASMEKRIWIGAEVFMNLKKLLKKSEKTTLVGDEGGFAPNLKAPNLLSNEVAMQYIIKAIKAAGYTPGKDVYLASDPAASEFYSKGKGYDLHYKEPKAKGKKYWSADQITDLWASWIDKYHFLSVEDPLNEESWQDWQLFTKKLGKKVQIVGDDLFVTNTKRLQKGIDMGVANAILVKVNQIGSLSESIDAIQLARKNKYNVIISHRSGETADAFISDLSLAVNADFIKAGSLSRSDRVEKYNRLMEIELELKNRW